MKRAPAIIWRGVRFLLFAACVLFALPASAQTYVNGTDGAINGSTTCAAPLSRTFNVTTAFNVSDVDLGVFATHSWRGDMRITLISPDGTSVQLVDGETNNTNGDNFNVLLNDSGTQTVNTDTLTAPHSTAAPPPFANNFTPNSPLAAFNGEPAFGIWTMQICDLFPTADDGLFQHAELYLTAAPANFADLSLTKTVNNPAPLVGNSIIYTLTLSNSGSSTETATGINVTDVLPAGVNYASDSGAGAYDPLTGIWNVASLAPGNSVTLTIGATVTATAGATITNEAEITASSEVDSDSTPNNASIGEDDYAAASFTVGGTRVAGVAPTLVCPNGFSSFDWAGRTWPQGSPANNYTLTGVGAFNWSISSPAGFMDIASLGGQHPVLTTAAQSTTSLSKAIDFANDTQFATTTISLGTAVDGAQFVVFDVDYAANDFADRLRVYGEHNGVTVIPILTNGTANYVIGNEAFGDAGSDPADPDGNVTITFNGPVDTIFIDYGNHSLAPADPDGQAIQMSGGVTICSAEADLTVLKSSVILEDPVNGTTNPKAIPGARLRYCILLSNTGTSAAENISASDTLPADITFLPGTILSGLNCASSATVEDDDATGADESDPVGADFSAGVLTYSNTAVNGGTTAAITFEATLD